MLAMSIPNLPFLGLQGRIFLLMLATLLLSPACCGFPDPRSNASEHAAVGRQVFANDTRVFSVSAGPPDSVALSLDHQAPDAISSPLLAKRFSEVDYQRYRAHGDAAYNAIQRLFTRVVLHECEPPPFRNFQPQDFRNGWSGTEGNSLPREDLWPLVFERLLGKRPTKEQIFKMEMRQDKPFFNSLGQQGMHVTLYPGEERATYTQYHIPALSAIISDHSQGPMNWIKTRHLRAGQPFPTNKYIMDRLVPPLNRWSDVTWTLWKQKAGNNAGNLRYIARNAILNRDTRSVMSYIYDKHGGANARPYPGLEFGMDTEEGRTLLGTPNGIGVAWILMEHWKDLGRRNPRVRIFNMGDNLFYMLWDLVPP
ncbi:MAG: hypothetical protein LQ344_004172 [Seirophora lacunosa]|nr:MAG: hypothetical protein LQ344_004172 [Seirophora lacunosa]